MSDAVVNWGGVRPSITYGPKDNRVVVSIGSLGSWVKRELYLPSEEVVENKVKDSLDETLVGVVQPKGQNTIVSSSSGNLGPKFYHHEKDGDDAKESNKNEDALIGKVHSGGRSRPIYRESGSLGPKFYHHEEDSEYVNWLMEYPESEYDILTMSYHLCLSDERLSSRGEDYLSLEPCEVFTEEEWILGGLTPWVDGVDEGEINAIHVDGTQDDEAILEASKLEEPLHFKTTSTGIIVGHDIKDYPNVPADWYRNKDEQTHISEGDWWHVDVKTKNGKIRQIKMGSNLDDEEVKEYSNLVEEFSDTFAWSYDELKGIPQEMVEHRIPLIREARLIRQEERRKMRMNNRQFVVIGHRLFR